MLLHLAPHIIRPLIFVLPHDPSMRPVWMIKAGLWLYDHLGGHVTLPGSKAVDLPAPGIQRGPAAPTFRTGFVYSDCRVDDSRLTVINAVSAREKGARCSRARVSNRAKRVDGVWEAVIAPAGGGSGPCAPRGS